MGRAAPGDVAHRGERGRLRRLGQAKATAPKPATIDERHLRPHTREQRRADAGRCSRRARAARGEHLGAHHRGINSYYRATASAARGAGKQKLIDDMRAKGNALGDDVLDRFAESQTCDIVQLLLSTAASGWMGVNLYVDDKGVAKGSPLNARGGDLRTVRAADRGARRRLRREAVGRPGGLRPPRLYARRLRVGRGVGRRGAGAQRQPHRPAGGDGAAPAGRRPRRRRRGRRSPSSGTRNGSSRRRRRAPPAPTRSKPATSMLRPRSTRRRSRCGRRCRRRRRLRTRRQGSRRPISSWHAASTSPRAAQAGQAVRGDRRVRPRARARRLGGEGVVPPRPGVRRARAVRRGGEGPDEGGAANPSSREIRAELDAAKARAAEKRQAGVAGMFGAG